MGLDRTERLKLKDISNDDLFSLFKDYLEKTIAKDLGYIYGKEARLLDSEEPWIFQLDG